MSPCVIKAIPIILPKFALVGSDQATFRLRDLNFKSRNNVTDRNLCSKPSRMSGPTKGREATFPHCIFREIPAFGEAIIELPQRAELEQSVLNVTQ